MTTQVKDLALPHHHQSFPSPPPTPPASSSSTSATSAASFFEDISHLDDTSNDAAPTTTATRTTQSNVSDTMASSLSPMSPMQLVTLSNLKLNSDMFSNRSLSIHRRILVKNFLTLLYQLNPPMDWMQMQMRMQQIDYGEDDFGPLPSLDGGAADDSNMLLREDEQTGWMERTLSAAGLSENDDDYYNDRNGFESTTAATRTITQKRSTNPFDSLQGASMSAPASTSSSNATARSSGPTSLLVPSFSLSSSSPSKAQTASGQDSAPLPRPKSTELPQSLHSYLSTVFDVDWSVELPSKEDLLFTNATGSASSSNGSSLSPSSSLSSVGSKRKSISAASGLSSVSNAYSSILNHSSSSAGPSATSPRSSTTSTSSSFSSLSSASSASSISSVGSTRNGTGIAIGSRFNKRRDLVRAAVVDTVDNDSNNHNSNLSGATKAGPASTTLVRKSSLPSNHSRNNNQGGNNTGASGGNVIRNSNNNTTNNVSNIASSFNPSNTLSDGRNMPVKKASLGGHSKQMLVPGRRSSLLQTGQMPPTLSPTGSSGSSISASNNSNGLSRMNSGTTALSLDPTRSPSPVPSSSASLSPTSATLPPVSPPLSFTNTSTSPTLHPLKPSFSRRTSSLPSERPKPVQRTPSSESNLASSITASGATSPTMTATTLSVPQANIIGLPRPLLNPTPSSSLLSSSPPSPPTLIPSSANGTPLSGQPSLHKATPRQYLRSASDDQILSRPSLPSSHSSFSPSEGAASPSHMSTLSRPSPTYLLKASKSSPCLLGSENETQEQSSVFPAMPELYVQQQYQQLPYQHYQNPPSAQPLPTPAGGAGLKLLARTSSRRGMAPLPSGQVSGAGSEPVAMAPSQGAMNISAPLPLIPNSPSYNDYEGYDHSPYGHGHAYAQSMSNVSVMTSNSSSTIGTHKNSRSQIVDNKPAAAGRWNSMKMMLGLRVGQGAKG